MLTAAEAASRTVAALSSRIDLSHDEQSIALVLISQAIEADRASIYAYYADAIGDVVRASDSAEDERAINTEGYTQ